MKIKAAITVNRLIWLLPLLLLACSAQPLTPYQLAAASGDSGFGGTGIILYSAEDDEGSSGFGGTGIVGNIDAFGSIWVNGIEVDYDDEVQITSNLAGSESRLKLGQTVILETASELNSQNRPYTEQIRIHYAMAGQIQAVESDRIKMHDQWVALPEAVQQDPGLILQRNRFIAINAYQGENGQWTVSRLSANPGEGVIVPGSVEVEFSDQVRQIIVGDRFDFIRPDLHRQGAHPKKMERHSIPSEQWHPSHANKPEPPATKSAKPESLDILQELRHQHNGLRHGSSPRHRR